jgi:hypothetical protein
VRILRGKIEEIPGGKHHVVLGFEAAKDLQWQASSQREVVLAAITPTASAEALQQEYVVRIEVRSDAPARRGVAHHQVVQPRERQERETSQQCVGLACDEIDALHQ